MGKTKVTRCYLCENELNKIAVGLNKKFLGRKIERFSCLECLAEYLDISVDDLLEKAEEFKSQGCILFK